MSASSSLSRLELVLNSSSSSNTAASSSSSSSGGSLFGSVQGWINSSTSNSATAGSSSSSATSSASSAAAAAAVSAQAAAAKVSGAASEWFNVLSSKVTGKEHVPMTSDIETGSANTGAGGGAGGTTSLLGGADSAVANQFSSELSALASLSWKQRLMAFMMCLIAGFIMLFLSFSFLPMVFVGAPAKFAISYALASMFLLGSSCFLVGPSKQLAQMFTGDRALPSTVYIGSLLLTFYVSWQIRYFFIVIPVLLVQFAATAFYIMSYVPFGQGVLKKICSWTLGRHLSFLN